MLSRHALGPPGPLLKETRCPLCLLLLLPSSAWWNTLTFGSGCPPHRPAVSHQEENRMPPIFSLCGLHPAWERSVLLSAPISDLQSLWGSRDPGPPPRLASSHTEATPWPRQSRRVAKPIPSEAASGCNRIMAPHLVTQNMIPTSHPHLGSPR